MTRDHVVTAKREGTPFKISMADGQTYIVSHPDAIYIGKTTVTVFDDKDCPHVLPLLTMTGLNYLPKAASQS